MWLSVLLAPAQPSLTHGQQTHLPSRMFDYVAQDQQGCLIPSSFFCKSFTRLAGLLQYPCLYPLLLSMASSHACCSFFTGTSANMHVCYSFVPPADTFESVSTDLQHICCSRTEPSIYVTLASDPQLGTYARTQPTGW